jgi:hypothetical protein
MARQADPDYEPRLYDAGGDITKRWVIDYRIWHVGKQAFVRKQYTGMNSYLTLKTRYAAAYEALREIKRMVKEGYTVGEVHSETASEAPAAPDPFDLQVFTLEQALTYFLNYKNATVLANEHRQLAVAYNEGLARISKNTFANYKTLRSLVLQWLQLEGTPDMLLATFKRKECDRFFLHLKENLKQSNKTFNKYRGFLSTVLNFFIESQELEIKNPVKKVQHLTAEESDMHEPVQPAHLQKIREHLTSSQDRQMYLFIGFLYYTFTRPHEEVRLLKVGDIREKTIFIPAKRAKSNRGEHISIPAGLEALITEFGLRKYPPDYYVFTLKGKPGLMHVGEKYFYRKHQYLLAALDLDGLNYSLYGYKHTGALELYAMTKDILAVKTHCRHTSSTQTDTYLRKYGAMINEKAILMIKF